VNPDATRRFKAFQLSTAMALSCDAAEVFEVCGRLTDEDARRLEIVFDDVAYKEARVYSSAEGEHVNLHRRSSEVHTGHDEKVFEVIRRLVLPLLCEARPGSWTLLANHYDLVRYGKGGFFSKHVDFTPVVTPYSTHFVVLLCLRGECTGGTTRVWLSDGSVVSSSATTTRGDFLVFRGDLAHAGEGVACGHKVIVRFDVLFSPSKVYDLPFFDLQRRFVSLGGQAGDGLSSEEMSLLELYVSGNRVPDRDIAQLHAVLHYMGCPEASALEASSFARFVRDGFVIGTADDVKTAIWEAGARRGMCGLLMVVGSRHETMEYEESGVWKVTGSAIFFRDGTPAFLSGFERCRKKIGFHAQAAVQKFSKSCRRRLGTEIFGAGTSHPRSMERDAVIWVASTEMQREPEDILLGLGDRLEDVAADEGAVVMNEAADADYEVWAWAVQDMLSTIVTAAVSDPRLSSQDHWPAFTSTSIDSVRESCNCDGEDVTYSQMYSTVVYNEAWCLVRHGASLERKDA